MRPRETIQKRLLNLGGLNSTQLERWQRSIEVIHEDGASQQMRFFTDRDGGAPQPASSGLPGWDVSFGSNSTWISFGRML